MRSPRHPTAILHKAVLVVMLLAFGIGAMQPRGTMAVATASGGLVLVLCSGTGPVQMVLDPVTGTVKPLPDEAPAKPCDWAMAQGCAIETTQVLAALFDAALRPAFAEQIGAPYWPAHDPRGLYARGPPALI